MTDLSPAQHQELRMEASQNANVVPATIEAPAPVMHEQSRVDRISDEGQAMDAPIVAPAEDTATPNVPVPVEPVTARTPTVPASGGSVSLSGMPMISAPMPNFKTSFNSKVGSSFQFKPINMKGIGLPPNGVPSTTVNGTQNTPTPHTIRRPLLGNNLGTPAGTLSFATPVLKTTANTITSTNMLETKNFVIFQVQ